MVGRNVAGRWKNLSSVKSFHQPRAPSLVWYVTMCAADADKMRTQMPRGPQCTEIYINFPTILLPCVTLLWIMHGQKIAHVFIIFHFSIQVSRHQFKSSFTYMLNWSLWCLISVYIKHAINYRSLFFWYCGFTYFRGGFIFAIFVIVLKPRK